MWIRAVDGMGSVRTGRGSPGNPRTQEIPNVTMTAAPSALLVCRDASRCLGKPSDIDELLEAVERPLHTRH
jgi:hypothetical protein